MKTTAISIALFIVAFLVTLGNRLPYQAPKAVESDGTRQMSTAIEYSSDAYGNLKSLLDKGADPNGLIKCNGYLPGGVQFPFDDDGKMIPALQYALKIYRARAVRMLVEHGADWRRCTMAKDQLVYCAAMTDIALFKEIMETGVDPNIPIGYSQTRLLNVFAEDQNGYGDIGRWSFSGTVQEIAQMKRQEEMAKLQRRKDIVACAEWLIDKGANVNMTPPYGEAAIHVAARNVNETLFLRMLIRKGADVNIKDGQGRTPLDVAVLALNPKAIDVLKKAGGTTRFRPESEQVGDMVALLKRYGARDAK